MKSKITRGVAILVLLAMLVSTSACVPVQPIPHPLGQDEIIVQKSHTDGGPLPPTHPPQWTRVPDFTLYGDGTFIYTKHEYHPPSEWEYELLWGKLNERAIQELLNFIVEENKFFESKAWYEFPVVDAGIVVLRVNAEGKSRVVIAPNALILVDVLDADGKPKHYTGTPKDWEQLQRLAAIEEKLDQITSGVMDGPDYQYFGEYGLNSLVLYAYMWEPIDSIHCPPWPLENVDLSAISTKPEELGERILEGTDAKAVQQNLTYLYSSCYSYRGSYFAVDYRPQLPCEQYQWFGRLDNPLRLTPHITSTYPRYGRTTGNNEIIREGISVSFSFQEGAGMGPKPTQTVRIFLDEQEITNGLSWTTAEDTIPSSGICCFKPEQPLAKGCHILRVVYCDTEGKHYEYIGQFFIDET